MEGRLGGEAIKCSTLRRITVISKGHSAGSDPNDRKEEGVSNPEPSPFGFSWIHSLLRRAGHRGEGLGSRQSISCWVDLVNSPYATQDTTHWATHCNLHRTLLGVEMLEIINNTAEVDGFRACVMCGTYASALSELDHPTTLANQIKQHKTRQRLHWIAKHIIRY